ncbi:MAG: class I SAM-dependent methyltransferase [Anaerolineae bacterium]|nr:class I SAM-dependent methyltransferase [Anaerolineae bacterium]
MNAKRHAHPVNLVSLCSPDWQDYALLDSGNGRKLERFGPYTLIRPEPKATWPPALSSDAWQQAHATLQLTGKKQRLHWQIHKDMDRTWIMHYKTLRFRVSIDDSRHLGVFPENAAHWDWIDETILAARRPANVLNLFAYTGLATLAAAQAGDQITHIDSSKKAVAIARENQALSNLEDRPIRWIVEDALKFVQREVRRGTRYDGLIMDPPRFGRGPKGQVWDFFDHFPVLCEACRAVLTQDPLFIIITAYAMDASTPDLYRTIEQMMDGFGGTIAAGKLVTVEQSAGRTISNAIFARWRTQTTA